MRRGWIAATIVFVVAGAALVGPATTTARDRGTAATTTPPQDQGTAGFQPPPVVTVPAALPGTPTGYTVDASTAINKADEDPVIQRLRRRLGPLAVTLAATTDHWEITYAQNNVPVGLAFVSS